MNRRGWLACARACVTAACLMAAPSSAMAGDRYVLVVTGASGGPDYAQKYATWRRSLTTTLRDTFGYPVDHVTVLGEEAGPGVGRATRDNVRAALTDLRRRAVPDDVVFVFLMGHGASEGEEAKFNLVGPDLGVDEWAALVKPIAGRVVFVDGASGSFPFLRRLAGPDRIVITANDSAAQEFETSFPEFFLKAFADPGADLDRNGRLSIWEAFAYASAGVRQGFQQRGELATERPMLDDTGRGVGRDAQAAGADGALAQVTYLQMDRPLDAPKGSVRGALLGRRADLAGQVDLLRARKANLPPAEYDASLERLLLEIARLDREIRQTP